MLLRSIGQSIGTKAAMKLTESLQPFTDPKDAVKCVCKDFWYYCFRQQVGRLQANRKGVFVIHDSLFPLLQTLSRCCVSSSSSQHSSNLLDPFAHSGIVSGDSSDKGPSVLNINESENSIPRETLTSKHVLERAMRQLEFPSGMIEGFLSAVGFDCSVEPSVGSPLPACAFQVTIREASSTVLDPTRLLAAVSITETASI